MLTGLLFAVQIILVKPSIALPLGLGPTGGNWEGAGHV